MKKKTKQKEKQKKKTKTRFKTHQFVNRKFRIRYFRSSVNKQ